MDLPVLQLTYLPMHMIVNSFSGKGPYMVPLLNSLTGVWSKLSRYEELDKKLKCCRNVIYDQSIENSGGGGGG